MASLQPCPDNPEALFEQRVCLQAISKDLEGELRLLEDDGQDCPDDCRTLKTVHLLDLNAAAHALCDEASALDGRFSVRDLTHAFQDGDGNRRGVHAGTFRWLGTGIIAAGSVSGITNAGTHRGPIHDMCQPCDAHGWMEGRFCGRIVRTTDQRLAGCQLLGTYRLRFDQSTGGGSGPVRGTLEGSLLCPCQAVRCVDLRGLPTGAGPNPRVEQGVEFAVFDHLGNLTANTEIRTDGGFTGLGCGFATEAHLPAPAQLVRTTLVHFARPATVQAISGGAVVATAVMAGPQAQPETLQLTGAGIDRVVVGAPQDETLLIELCYEPQ